MQKFNFSSASEALVEATHRIAAGPNITPPASTSLGHQFLRIFAVFSNASATATLKLVLANADDASAASGSNLEGVIFEETITITAGARRSNWANTGGGYVAGAGSGTGVIAQISGRDTCDLHGASGPNQKSQEKVFNWYLVCSALSAGTLEVFVEPGFQI